MPIVYVHGVSTRKTEKNYTARRDAILHFLKAYVAPVVSPNCECSAAYWGDHGATFAWNGESRPRTRLFGQGAAGVDPFERAMSLSDSEASLSMPVAAAAPVRSRLTAGGAAPTASAAVLRLKDLSSDQLSDLLAAQAEAVIPDAIQLAEIVSRVDAVVTNPATTAELQSCNSLEEELKVLEKRLASQLAGKLAAQGGDGKVGKMFDRLREVASRTLSASGFIASAVVAETRGPVNTKVTLFIGDVFAYLDARGTFDKPGLIVQDVLDELRAAKKRAPEEPLIVLTHSMGGQIIYDIVTYFLPESKSNLRVDFWCATASQVGLFEEMKRFRISSGQYSAEAKNKVPLPDAQYLGGWWNVWDYNDYLSFTAEPVFDGVDDGPFNGGASLVHAHSEYLERPSFYRKLAAKVKESQVTGWRRP